MLLQKLRGSHCCLLDVAPFPLGELGGLKVSRSGVDSGIGESVATGSLTHSTTAPPTDRPQSPGPKNHSATLHNLVQLCLQQQPERRWFQWISSQMELKRNTTTFTYSTDTQTLMLVLVLFVFQRPSASELLTHAFFKQVGSFSRTSSLKAKLQKQNKGNKFKRVGFYFENFVWAGTFCSVTGEEAHQWLLPQSHVPSSAPRQSWGPSSIQPPHPFLSHSSVSHRRLHWGRLGFLLTAASTLPLTSKPNTRQSKKSNEAKFYCAFNFYY